MKVDKIIPCVCIKHEPESAADGAYGRPNLQLFGGFDEYGYSCLVFKDGHHVHYANDYQLHHSNKNPKELRAYYAEKLGRILFADEEIGEPLSDYDEYKRKEYFLRNYYIMRVDYLSMFGCRKTKEEIAAYNRKKAKMHFDPVGFAYVKDPEFVKRHLLLFNKLVEAKLKTDMDYEYQKTAFLTEMYNHEYGINWQADFDTLSAFGNIHTPRSSAEDTLESYFEQLEFNEVQRRAYLDAREEYYKHVTA